MASITTTAPREAGTGAPARASRTEPGPAPAGAQSAPPVKKSKKKLMIVLLLVVVAVAGVGYKTMMKKPAGSTGGPPTTLGGPLTEEASLTVNLRDGHYLEFTAAIQTLPGRSAKVLTKDQAIVLDILNNQAKAMTEAQLLTAAGPAELKASIVHALNHEFSDLVEAIYFEQFVMQ